MTFQKLTAEQLRQHKGISFTGITTVFVCHDGKGKIFLTKRSKNTRDEHGRWDVGAGGLKHGQAIEENMLREVKEEYDVVPLEYQFLGYFDAFRQAPDGQPTHWLAMVFALHVDPSKVKIMEPGMIDDSGWFTLDNLPSPLHSQFPIYLEKFSDKLSSIIGQ